jgi:hypothetical protein
VLGEKIVAVDAFLGDGRAPGVESRDRDHERRIERDRALARHVLDQRAAARVVRLDEDQVGTRLARDGVDLLAGERIEHAGPVGLPPDDQKLAAQEAHVPPGRARRRQEHRAHAGDTPLGVLLDARGGGQQRTPSGPGPFEPQSQQQCHFSTAADCGNACITRNIERFDEGTGRHGPDFPMPGASIPRSDLQLAVPGALYPTVYRQIDPS